MLQFPQIQKQTHGILHGEGAAAHNSFWVDSKSVANVAKRDEANQLHEGRLACWVRENGRYGRVCGIAASCNYNKKMISVWQIGKTFCGWRCCILLPQLPLPIAVCLLVDFPNPFPSCAVIHLYGNLAHALAPLFLLLLLLLQLVITISIRTTCGAAAEAEINKKKQRNGNGNKRSR